MSHQPLLVIELGAVICSRLKKIYYPDTAWVDCYKQIANDFTKLKTRARIFYGKVEDEALLKELCKYSDQDIRDGIE